MVKFHGTVYSVYLLLFFHSHKRFELYLRAATKIYRGVGVVPID